MSTKTEYETVTGTGETDFTGTETGSAATPPKKKSSSMKVIVVAMLVGLVGLVGFYTFRIMTKPAPAPRPAATATKAPPAAAPTPAPTPVWSTKMASGDISSARLATNSARREVSALMRGAP